MSRAKEETKFLLTYKFRAYPSALLEFKMENWLYILHNLYNQALEERKRAWKEEKKSITYSHQQNDLPKLKEKDPSLKLVHSQVLQDRLRRVDNAFQKFFRKEAKYPKKKKLSRYNSFTFPQVWMKQKGKLIEVIKLERKNNRFAYLHLPKLGKLKIRLHREIDWTKAKTVTVKREPSGKWYVCVTVEAELDHILKEARGKAVGIDLISFEDLDVKALVQNSNLAKLILDAGWGTLITFVTYKAVMAGARVVRVDPSCTTQDCSVCGFRVPKILVQRLHECSECGAVMDRDYNASVNILKRSLVRLKGGRVGATQAKACGEGVKPSLKQESPCGSSGWG